MFDRLPMYQQKGFTALRHKLDNIQNLVEVLGNPHKQFKSIHVAGTNGKGSSSHMLASILQEAGYNVGLCTSPHLKDFRERIKINGRPVSKAYVRRFIGEQKPFLELHDLSFFEMTVGMAFAYFAKKKIDIAVIEVGLGGRLDSTNIIIPEVSLITNIGLDHTHILGNTLEKIALEKAGTIKSGIPVVISERQPETEGIFKMVASQRKCAIVFAECSVTKSYHTDLLGAYQKKNVKGVVAVIEVLKGFEVTDDHIGRGLANCAKNTGILGRWQILGKRPTVVCDTAHNREGLAAALKQVGKQNFARLHMVLGFVKDKNLDQLLPLFSKEALYYFVAPNMPRAFSAKSLQEKAKEFGLEGTVFGSVKKGFRAAQRNAGQKDFIYVGGSTFVVAEIV